MTMIGIADKTKDKNLDDPIVAFQTLSVYSVNSFCAGSLNFS
jgi:hypothetical protein